MAKKAVLQNLLVGLIFLCLTASAALAQTTAFNYQGRLTDAGLPPTANYDFTFTLYDAGGAIIAGQQRLNVSVVSGAFNVALDFGAGAFPGANRFLEIAVRPAGGGAFTTLAPRQPILSTPYVIKALSATNADNATQLGGVDSSRFIQQDAVGNVSIAGGLTVAGSLSLNTVNAQTQYNLGGNRILSAAGAQNLFIGLNSGRDNSTGFLNTFVGSAAGQANTTGVANSFFGANAGATNLTGGDNSFFGDGAGLANVLGSRNAFFGRQAGLNNTANDNSFFGAFAGLSNTTGLFNTLLGAHAGDSNTTGSGNTYVGTSSGAANQSGSNNSFLGLDAGRNNTASNNAFFGYSAGYLNTTGSGNSYFGYTAGYSNTSGDFNAFFGAVAGGNNTTGRENSFFGDGAGAGNVSSSNNTFVGRQAGLNNTADNNSFFGRFAGQTNTTGTNNAFFGNLTGLRNSTGTSNAFFGSVAGNGNTTGSSNSFFGFGTGFVTTTGFNNTFLGTSAGNSNTTGSSNTLVGAGANVNANNLTNATAIGANAVVSNSNSLILGNNANIGIGTSTPNSKLTVVGLIETTTGGVKFPDGTIQTTAGGGVSGVTSLNGLTNNVTLAAGSNITITPAGNTLTIASMGGSGILNQTTQQASANFNIDGTGTANIFNAAEQYNLGGPRVLGNPGQNNLFAGIGAGAVTPVLGDNNIENSLFGRSAGQNNIGCCNAFFGNYSGQNNTTGGSNTFLGYQAGRANTQGSNNTFVGINAASSFNTGNGNTFVGDRAGNVATSGSSNTMLGQNANFAFGANNLSFATAIGAGAQVDASNTVVIGKAAVGSFPADTVRIPGNLVVNGTFTNPSDLRLKTGIANLRYGLSEVMRLRPVTWEWKNDSLNSAQLGLIAQEVQPVLPELIVQGTGKDRLLSMNYIGLLPVLIKAIQEQEATITTLRNEIYALQKQKPSGTADTRAGIGTTAPKATLDVTGGNSLVGSPGQGIILKSPNGATCRLLSIDNAGAMGLTAVACP